jgi:hypothetical protein
MSQQLRSLFRKSSLALSLVIMFSGANVNALPASNDNNLGNYNFKKLFQVISQSNTQPPEVIIDENRTSGSSSTTRTTNSTYSTSSDTRFRCEMVNGEYTVMYYPESRPNQAYPWAIPSQLGGGWTPENRCYEITRRLESYRQDGLLELTTGIENGYDTICVTTQVDPTDCKIVLTVPPGQDPQITRDQVFENLLVADDGQQTQGVYTYTENDGGDILNQIGNVLGGGKKPVASPKDIDLRPFLDPADGGTGTRLRTTSNSSSQPQERKPSLFK